MPSCCQGQQRVVLGPPLVYLQLAGCWADTRELQRSSAPTAAIANYLYNFNLLTLGGQTNFLVVNLSAGLAQID